MNDETTQQPDLLNRLETDVTELATRDDLTMDDLLMLYMKLDGVIKRARDAKAQLESFMVGWMPAHCPEARIGDELFCVGKRKTEKDRNVGATIRAILEAVGGDEQALMDCLSVNAVKAGAAKKVLGDRFDDFFETTYGDKLEVKRINTKFIKGAA